MTKRKDTSSENGDDDGCGPPLSEDDKRFSDRLAGIEDTLDRLEQQIVALTAHLREQRRGPR